MSANIPKIEYGGFVPTVINFTYPPEGYGEPEQFDAKERVTVALSGVRQVQVDHIEARRKLNFKMLTEDQVAELETFFLTWAANGKAFKYFDDKNSVDYFSYELNDLKFLAKRIAIAGDNAFFYEAMLSFRRVVGVTDAGGYLEQSILNNQAVALDITGLLLDEQNIARRKCFARLSAKPTLTKRLRMVGSPPFIVSRLHRGTLLRAAYSRATRTV